MAVFPSKNFKNRYFLMKLEDAEFFPISSPPPIDNRIFLKKRNDPTIYFPF